MVLKAFQLGDGVESLLGTIEIFRSVWLVNNVCVISVVTLMALASVIMHYRKSAPLVSAMEL